RMGVDGDARQQLARRAVGCAARDALGPHLHARRVGALDLDSAVGVVDLDLAAGLQRVGVGPLVGGPGSQVADVQVAAGQYRDERHQDQGTIPLLRASHDRVRTSTHGETLTRDITPPSARQFNWTEISFDTPGSSIVTPYSRSAISIVLRLWVMMMNCVCSCMPRSISTNRPMLASSSGASISSSRQNGLGLNLNMPNIRAIAVSAFSPPDRSWTLCSRLPGGCAMISMPLSSGSLSSSSVRPARPPPKSVLKVCWKLRLIAANA